MKYLFRVTIVLIGLLALFGCDQFFGANMFGAIDEPDPVAIDNLVEDLASLDDTNAASGVADLSAAVENDTFFADLIADVEAAETAGETTNQVTQILDFLGNQYLDETTGDVVTVDDTNREIVQDAAILAAKVVIETSTAAEMVDNVPDLIIAATAEEGDEDYVDLGSEDALIDLLVPESAALPETITATSLSSLTAEELEDVEEAKAEFTALVESLSTASTAYSAFGNALLVEPVLDEFGNPVDEDGDGVDDTEVIVPDDVNIGETAQAAVVAIMVDTVVDNLEENHADMLSEDFTAEELLFEMIYFPDEHAGIDLWTPTQEEDEFGNPVVDENNEPVYVEGTEDPLAAAFDDEGMENILAASGFLDMLEGMLGGGDDSDNSDS